MFTEIEPVLSEQFIKLRPIVQKSLFQPALTNSAEEQHKVHFAARRRTKFLISESSSPPDGHLSTDPVSSLPDVFLICFRLDSSVSLARVVSSWSAVAQSSLTVLVGTMSDIRESQANNFQQAQSVAKQIGAVSYIETSAKMSYSSTAAAFEAAASCQSPLSRQSSVMSTSSMVSQSRKFQTNPKYKHRDTSEPRTKSLTGGRLASLNCLRPSLSQARAVSASSASLHSKSSTLSSSKSSSSILSVSTNKTPVMSRRMSKQERGEQMVTIKVERLNQDRQMEEVEIEIPMGVYRNMDQEQNCDNDFVRNCGKRNSLASKLRQLMLRS